MFAELNSHNINCQHEKDFKGSGKLQKVINKMFADNFNKHGAKCGTASNKKAIKQVLHFGAALINIFWRDISNYFYHILIFQIIMSFIIREEDETKFNDLSMFDEKNLFDHMKKALHAMGSGWGLRGNDEHVNLRTDMLCIGTYAPTDPLYSVAKNCVGIKDFTNYFENNAYN